MPSLTRRQFLSSTTTLTAGLILGFYFPPSNRIAQAVESATHLKFNAWLKIGTDDTITVIVAHAEMGQGVYTALPMLVAEELEANWQQIRITNSPVSEEYKNPLVGLQITGGSTTIRSRWDGLRKAGAAAKEMLIEAAAQVWKVDPKECEANNSQIIHPATGRILKYSQLAEAAAKLTPPSAPRLKSSKEFKLIGQAIKRLDTPEKIDGSAQFGIDVRLPNMLYAALQQAPIFRSKVESYDASAAESLRLFPLSNGIAVIADSYWQAKQGLATLNLRFSKSELDTLDSAQLKASFQEDLQKTGAEAERQGDVAAALKKADKILEAEYSAPFLAHATMEPLNCTAHVQEDRCEIWVGTQAPEWARNAAVEITGLPAEKIEIHTTYLGGGFGRRVEIDCIKQCLTIAKSLGQPVQLIWSREEDMQHDFYRPAAAVRLTAGVDKQGKLTAFKARVVSPSISKRVVPSWLKGEIDPNAVEGFVELAYNIPNTYVDYIMKETPVPVGFWRSVGHSYSGFMMESFIDEIAHATDTDPYQLRKTLLAEQPRHLAVLETLVKAANWQDPLPPKVYRGLAIHASFASIVGQVAEISLTSSHQLTVQRVVSVIDCGMVVNPDTVKAQVESSIIFGLGALKQSITLKEGKVEQSNFHDFPILRLSDTPKIEIHIIDSQDNPGGVGEPATPPIIPAVTNALFAAIGKRIRELPIPQKII